MVFSGGTETATRMTVFGFIAAPFVRIALHDLASRERSAWEFSLQQFLFSAVSCGSQYVLCSMVHPGPWSGGGKNVNNVNGNEFEL